MPAVSEPIIDNGKVFSSQQSDWNGENRLFSLKSSRLIVLYNDNITMDKNMDIQHGTEVLY